jgi:hypothetical protein
MQYQLQWLIEKRVIFLSISGDVSLKDLADLMQSSQAMLESGTANIHVIVSIAQVGQIHLGIKDLVFFFRNEAKAVTIEGWNLVYGEANSLVKMMSEIAFQATGAKHRWLNTLEDCQQFLYEMDASLQGLPVNPIPTSSRDE